MRSLTNRLRLSWLTVAAFAAFVVVSLIGPDNVGVAHVLFASNADSFKALLLRQGEVTLRFETVNQLRAQLAADMTFLVAYGLLLRASIRALARPPLARFAPNGPIIVMIADAAENVSALKILRTLGEQTDASQWWFVVMNVAAATKWLVAGVVLLCLAVGWRREAARLGRGHRLLPWLIAGGFGVGGVASIAVSSDLGFRLTAWLAMAALMAPAAGFLLQFSLLGTGTLMLRFLYLSRAPLIILLILAAFGPVALGPAVDLLGGILVAGNITGIAVTTAAAIAVSFASRTQINIVRAYAWQRVQDNSLRALHHRVLAACVFWTGVVAAASLLFSVALVSLSLGLWKIAAGIVVGAVAAQALLFTIDWIAARLSYNPPGHKLPPVPAPFRWVPPLARRLKDARRAPPPAFKQRFVGWFASPLLPDETGYVEALPGGQRRILPGHTFATIQFVLTFVLFWLALYAKSRPGGAAFYLASTEIDAALLAPTVTSLVLLLLLLGWVFAGAGFFLDRYRIPLFTLALAAALTTGAWSQTDYVVPTGQKSVVYQLATPGQILKAFGERPLVVAAAGGGIQAGAWTARVLRGLDESLHRTLRRRVALISSVSGGSMAALYYGAFEAEPTLDLVLEQALKPSLDEITTSFVGRDIFAAIGLRLGPDRGAALEDTWEQRLPDVPKESLTLRSWSEDARDFALGASRTRPFPAFLFNSMVVESGQPIVFATTQLPTQAYRIRIGDGTSRYPTVKSANSILRLSVRDSSAHDIGLKAVTAARLSAAFPYVSPAATLGIADVEPYHLVDGGYYDFHGLVALSQWLDDALEELSRDNQGPPRLVGVVIARGLASSDAVLRDDDVPPRLVDPAIARRGWRWQLTAPPAAALHARTFGQWAGGMQTLRLLTGKWATRGVSIIPVLFDYPGKDRTPVCQGSPVSWKLTTPQQKCIEKAWTSFTEPLPPSLQ